MTLSEAISRAKADEALAGIRVHDLLAVSARHRAQAGIGADGGHRHLVGAPCARTR